MTTLLTRGRFRRETGGVDCGHVAGHEHSPCAETRSGRGRQGRHVGSPPDGIGRHRWAAEKGFDDAERAVP